MILITSRFDLFARLPENVKYTRKFPFCSINKKFSNIEHKSESVNGREIFLKIMSCWKKMSMFGYMLPYSKFYAYES